MKLHFRLASMFIAISSVMALLTVSPAISRGESFHVSADLDGNGERDSVSILRYVPNGRARVKVDFKSRGRAIRVEHYDLGNLNYDPSNQRWKFGDVDGDGAVDIIVIYERKKKAHVSVFRYSDRFKQKTTRLAGYWKNQDWSMADTNKDGRIDLINRYRVKEGTREWVHHGKKDATFEYRSSLRTIRPKR